MYIKYSIIKCWFILHSKYLFLSYFVLKSFSRKKSSFWELLTIVTVVTIYPVTDICTTPIRNEPSAVNYRILSVNKLTPGWLFGSVYFTKASQILTLSLSFSIPSIRIFFVMVEVGVQLLGLRHEQFFVLDPSFAVWNQYS